jgi:putative sigma-54 modulation protein
MTINVTGRHIDITDDIKNHAEKKTNKFKHYFDHILEMDLVLEKENTIYKAAATFDADKKRYHIEAKDYDLYESIDKLMDKVDRRIRRHKEKINSHHKRMSIAEASSEVTGEL